MLAAAGPPFDSPQHSFEIKWDGVRALARIEGRRMRLSSRRQIDLLARFPELEELRALPSGTLLDGEVVQLSGGRPDLAALLEREHSRSGVEVRKRPANGRATYVVFDLLYERFAPWLERPLKERRSRLERLVLKARSKRMQFSEGIIGEGQACFSAACAHGLEGVVAKRLSSPYLPGRRSPHWVKIKRTVDVACVILGYLQKGRNDFQSLVLAAELGSGLRYVGRAASGLTDAQRGALLERLKQIHRSQPLVPCPQKAQWVEPLLFCQVRAMEWTHKGRLRAPVIVALI